MSQVRTAWIPIRYPNAIWGDAEHRWICDAEVAETRYTAFGSRTINRQVTGRLIVRRVKRLNPAGQGELLPGYRHRAVLTDSPLTMLQAEACHRGHAIVEQVIADLKNGPLAHLPSGSFAANSAWLVCAAIAFNLTRAAGCLASTFHAKAATGTLRAQLTPSPAGSPDQHDASCSISPPTGRGNTPGPNCSPTPADHPSRRPDQPARYGPQPETKVEKPDRPHTPTRPNQPTKINYSADQRRSVNSG